MPHVVPHLRKLAMFGAESAGKTAPNVPKHRETTQVGLNTPSPTWLNERYEKKWR